ncbi:MAG: type VI secretion system ATPase TssH [Gammaproteobacteria bacterium]|nr:type VI secretion system ATPase TssH [Gammaproteobacteria bacterium]
MMEFDQLIKHLSHNCRDLFEKAVATASSRSHYAVDIEHWLWQALDQPDPELNSVLSHFDIPLEHACSDVLQALEELKTGHDGFPKIAPDTARLLFEGWMLASSQFQSLEIRPVHLLLALVENDALRLRVTRYSPALQKLRGEDMRAQCAGLLEGRITSSGPGEGASTAPTKTPALDQYTIDLTAAARNGKIDPVLGRDDEIRQMIDILCRRRQNNPILTGEAGVGKTAVVEGLARRIAEGDVPETLANIALRTLDMGLLQAGAGVKGEFENRLKNVIKEVQNSVQPIILFIDEAHTLVGAGNQSGAGDAANLLKPALARGELRTIAATTWAEYKKYFESDAALTRRFQVVKIEEPSEEKAIIMLRSMAAMLEQHHQVTILDQAVIGAVKLSHRYIAGRQLPDKCVSLLDTACARVNLSLRTKPPALARCEQQIRDIEAECIRLEREQRTGYSHESTIADLMERKTALETQKNQLDQSWQATQKLVNEIAGLRRQLESESATANDPSTVTQPNVDPAIQRQRLATLRKELTILQGEVPLIYECVDAQVVAEVVADWTGIPVGRMQSDEINNVLQLHTRMSQRVIGQAPALELIGKTMHTARAKLTDPRRPLGVFMLVGPSGIGKTETALALAEQLYGSERNLTIINMSEFKEEHKVSLLMGSPPGYVGYGEGGVLTEAVRRKPYCVLLLDEIEKAHPGVQDIFYQVFDKGMLRDGEGRDIDFKNTVIIMTSNTASEQIEQLCADIDTRPSLEGLTEAIGPALRQVYKPAFLGRVNIVPYYPLDDACLGTIARLQLDAIRRRVEENYQATLNYSDEFIEHIVSQCRKSDTGARQIHSVLTNTLLPTLSEKILSRLAAGKPVAKVKIGLTQEGDIAVDCSAAPVKRLLPRKVEKAAHQG